MWISVCSWVDPFFHISFSWLSVIVLVYRNRVMFIYMWGNACWSQANMVTSIEGLCAKHFTYITIFNPYSNLVRFLLPFTEDWVDIIWFTEGDAMSSRGRIWTRICPIWGRFCSFTITRLAVGSLTLIVKLLFKKPTRLKWALTGRFWYRESI